MRKRRCFADKELEAVMFERERQIEAEKIKQNGMLATAAVMDPSQSRHLLGQLQPREFLQRIFPTVNPNVLELVWQGCGGNLERAIEQLVSNASAASMAAAQQGAVPSSVAQQVALQQRLAVMVAAQSKQQHPSTLSQVGLHPAVATFHPHLHSVPMCQLKAATAAAAAAAMRPSVGCGMTASQGVSLATSVYPPMYQAAMLARMPFTQHQSRQHHATAPVPVSTNFGKDDLLSQKSAFQSHIPSTRSPDILGSRPASTSSSPDRPPAQSSFRHASSPGAPKPKIKFSVESIIGKG